LNKDSIAGNNRGSLQTFKKVNKKPEKSQSGYMKMDPNAKKP